MNTVITGIRSNLVSPFPTSYSENEYGFFAFEIHPSLFDSNSCQIRIPSLHIILKITFIVPSVSLKSTAPLCETLEFLVEVRQRIYNRCEQSFSTRIPRHHLSERGREPGTFYTLNFSVQSRLTRNISFVVV